MMRLPPRPTLFPYTTLFRSRRGSALRVAHPVALGDDRPLRRRPDAPARTAAGADAEEDDRHPEDRKSTRLNSSHMSISYAVFCLKKKKKNPIRGRCVYYSST